MLGAALPPPWKVAISIRGSPRYRPRAPEINLSQKYQGKFRKTSNKFVVKRAGKQDDNIRKRTEMFIKIIRKVWR